MSEDRRAAPRFACDVEATLELPDGRSLPARALDVSYSGICVTTEEPVSSGTTTNIRLKLLFDWAETDTLSIPGKVVWCTPVEGRNQIGARFDKNMDSRSWTRLDVLLQFLSGELEVSRP